MQRVQRRIYFDNSSTTKIHPEVLKSYERLLETYYVNSESLYDEGSEISLMMEKARGAIAGLLGVQSSDIIFTSGSSEANSSAIKGCALAQREKKHIITTNVEHSSILNACQQLEQHFGYHITYLPVDGSGKIRIEDLKKALDEDTSVVSIMYVNNESGAVNPISEIAEIVKKQSHAYFHVDLTQSIGKVPLDLHNVDMASLSAHKLEGLKGSGIFMKKSFVPFLPLINGGEQEYGIRGGTANACADMVFAKTLRLALENGQKYHDQIKALKDQLVAGLLAIPGVEINSPADAVVSTVNWSYEKIPSEVMQNALNAKGFMVSARSTCASKSDDPSYVLTAMGFSSRRASSCIRISLSYHNTAEEISLFLQSLKEIVAHYG
jgi:cysteine desulfurase